MTQIKVGIFNELWKQDFGDTRYKITVRNGEEIYEIVLIIINLEEIYAIDAICPHSGGPLFLGDIEDLHDEMSIICPYHEYEFNLKTGVSSYDFTAATYPVIINDGDVYISIHGEIISVEKIDKTSGCGTSLNLSTANIAVMEPVSRPSTISDNPETITEWAVLILNTPDPVKKVENTQKAFLWWNENKSAKNIGNAVPPSEPLRENLTIVDPTNVPRLKKGGTLNNRIAILHSLANIEQWAIDLAWDIIARFVNSEHLNDEEKIEFCTDFVKVANDEAKHFTLLCDRLECFGSYFGALSVHAGLWDSAMTTSKDFLERLAIVHMIHEARGLDVNPQTIQKFEKANDTPSVLSLRTIHEDEITHVATGAKWFNIYSKNTNIVNPIHHFQSICKRLFRGKLKPPFNKEDRLKAGLSEEWYISLQY